MSSNRPAWQTQRLGQDANTEQPIVATTLNAATYINIAQLSRPIEDYQITDDGIEGLRRQERAGREPYSPNEDARASSHGARGDEPGSHQHQWT